MPYFLFLSQAHLYRTSQEIEVRAQFVFEEPPVRLADVLREVAEECERWRAGRELCYILDLDVLALPSRWWIILDLREHYVIEL